MRARLVVPRESGARLRRLGVERESADRQQPPYDPAMGTYQLRGLLCRVSKLRPEDDHFGPPPLDDDEPAAATRRIAASPLSLRRRVRFLHPPTRAAVCCVAFGAAWSLPPSRRGSRRSPERRARPDPQAPRLARASTTLRQAGQRRVEMVRRRRLRTWRGSHRRP